MAMNDPATACLETEAILTEILDMIQTRASAVAVTGSSIRDLAQAFPHNATVIDKIQWLRDMILSLAPKFVDMDYPYFDQNWTYFPQLYSAAKLRDDPDHSLDILPAKGSSFDDDSIEVYRTALANMIYWLEKFRYVVSDKSFYDKTFKRDWYWSRNYDWSTWAYEYDSTENGVSGHESSMTGLAGRMNGVVDDAGPPNQFIGRYGHYVNYTCWDHRSKTYQYKDSYSDSKPMTQWEPVSHSFSLSHVPHILTTRNPTCFAPTLYWYIVPGGTHETVIDRDTSNSEVTEKEAWRTITWGPNDEYSATEYDAVDDTGRISQEGQTMFRGQWKTTREDVREGLQETDTRTNYSSDGQRSYTKTETTELTSPVSVSTQWYQINEDAIPTFGLVSMGANTAPRHEAGTIAPYSSLSWTVCSQGALIDPGIPQPVAPYVGMEACYDIDQLTWLELYCHSRWVPILDFGDFSTEVPQQNP